VINRGSETTQARITFATTHLHIVPEPVTPSALTTAEGPRANLNLSGSDVKA